MGINSWNKFTNQYVTKMWWKQVETTDTNKLTLNNGTTTDNNVHIVNVVPTFAAVNRTILNVRYEIENTDRDHLVTCEAIWNA